MDPGSTPTPAIPGEGTITSKIARVENLTRLFHLDTALEVIGELPARDPRRASLLKHFEAEREHLARSVFQDDRPRMMAMLANDHHPGGRCSCLECLRRFPPE